MELICESLSSTLRRKLAVVSQDTFIFNTSVRNIAYGLETVDEATIWEAARLANALEFIQHLPEGFDTQLGDRGSAYLEANVNGLRSRFAPRPYLNPG